VAGHQEDGEGDKADYVLVDGDIASEHVTGAETEEAQEKLEEANDGFHYFVVSRKDWEEEDEK
jgi:hypothetical protein